MFWPVVAKGDLLVAPACAGVPPKGDCDFVGAAEANGGIVPEAVCPPNWKGDFESDLDVSVVLKGDVAFGVEAASESGRLNGDDFVGSADLPGWPPRLNAGLVSVPGVVVESMSKSFGGSCFAASPNAERKPPSMDNPPPAAGFSSSSLLAGSALKELSSLNDPPDPKRPPPTLPDFGGGNAVSPGFVLELNGEPEDGLPKILPPLLVLAPAAEKPPEVAKLAKPPEEPDVGPALANGLLLWLPRLAKPVWPKEGALDGAAAPAPAVAHGDLFAPSCADCPKALGWPKAGPEDAAALPNVLPPPKADVWPALLDVDVGPVVQGEALTPRAGAPPKAGAEPKAGAAGALPNVEAGAAVELGAANDAEPSELAMPG